MFLGHRRLTTDSASFVGELDPQTSKPEGHGKAVLRTGSIYTGAFKQGKADAKRDEAWKLVDGAQASTISLEEAMEIATELGVMTIPSLDAPKITHWQPGVSVQPQAVKEDAPSSPSKVRRKSARSDI